MQPVSLQLVAAGGLVLLCACADTSYLAPAAPDVPAPFPSSEAERTTPAPAAVASTKFAIPPNTAVEFPSSAGIGTNHVYGLVELIDIAQRRNPATRVAWEEARQAAIKVGIAEAAYLPALTASALAGYERIAFPMPTNLVPAGFATSNNREVVPAASVKYLLLDFGGRAAAVEEASQLSVAANAEFTTAHQKLIYTVARGYFMLDGANATVSAAQQGLADARALQESAEAIYQRGLGNVVQVDLARRATAQAQFDLSQTYTAQKNAMSALLEAMGLPPTTKLRVASVSERPLPPRTARTVDGVLREALRRRPDLLADVAKLRASDANIAAARSELLPKISLSANISNPIWSMNVDTSPYFKIRQPQGAALLKLEWALYDAELLQHKLRIAESQRNAAADDLQVRTNQALREVALAYDQVETGLQQYNAALALRIASEAAFRSASDSYKAGVGTVNDATTAQTGLSSARAAVARAHAQVLINGAALALATGFLTSSADFGRGAPR